MLEVGWDSLICGPLDPSGSSQSLVSTVVGFSCDPLSTNKLRLHELHALTFRLSEVLHSPEERNKMSEVLLLFFKILRW